jgi:hypothetical protein
VPTSTIKLYTLDLKQNSIISNSSNAQRVLAVNIGFPLFINFDHKDIKAIKKAKNFSRCLV